MSHGCLLASPQTRVSEVDLKFKLLTTDNTPGRIVTSMWAEKDRQCSLPLSQPQSLSMLCVENNSVIPVTRYRVFPAFSFLFQTFCICSMLPLNFPSKLFTLLSTHFHLLSANDHSVIICLFFSGHVPSYIARPRIYMHC